MKIAQRSIERTEIDRSLNAKYTLIVEQNLIKLALDYNSSREPVRMGSYIYNKKDKSLAYQWMEKEPWVNYPREDHPIDKQIWEQIEQGNHTPKEVLKLVQKLKAGRQTKYKDGAEGRELIKRNAEDFELEFRKRKETEPQLELPS